jgi:hypothetical protein
MPKGWPIEIAPPFTFILLWSMPRTSAQCRGTVAKASFNSLRLYYHNEQNKASNIPEEMMKKWLFDNTYQRSMSATVSPWRARSLGTATVGPIPISSGAHPPTAKPMKAPRGLSPNTQQHAIR